MNLKETVYESPEMEIFEIQVEQPLLKASGLLYGEDVEDDEVMDY